MLLSELINNLDIEKSAFFEDFEVESIESDSRKIGKNNLFVALDGDNNRGVDFVPQAIERGARAVVIDRKDDYSKFDKYISSNKIALLRSFNPRNTLVQLLKRFYNNEFPEHILGITGTTGKTSVVEFIRQMLTELGYGCASLGTLGLKYNDQTLKENSLTMMEIVDLYRKLHFLKGEQNIDFVAMEITSQGLATHRFDGLKVQVAGVTNITDHEHLDYHGDIESYFDSKMDLFRYHCEDGATVVLNPDTTFYEKIVGICKDKKYDILTFGESGADVELISNSMEKGFQKFSFRFQGKIFNVKSRLFGAFQVLNLLQAFGFVYALNAKLNLGLTIEKIVETMENVLAAEGRMKFVTKTHGGGYVYIDYAHTPTSFEVVLGIVREQLRKIGNGKLISLFGLGGERDRSKRPLMGQLAQKYSDVVIVTDDNPRSEDPAAIRREVMAGCDEKLGNVYNFSEGREEAIKFAMSLLKKDDVLILLGKGHEKYQILGKEKVFFSEEDVVRRNA